MTAAKVREVNLNDDVQVIREILFGEQVKLFKERIEALEEAVASLQQENNQLREALSAEAQARQREDRAGGDQLGETHQQLLSGMKALEEQLAGQIESECQDRKKAVEDLDGSVREQFEQTHRQNAQEFAALHQLHHTSLEQQEELTAALAAALTTYRKRIAPKEASKPEGNG